jgi:hypothetical protein
MQSSSTRRWATKVSVAGLARMNGSGPKRAPRDEGRKREIDRVQHHELELTKATMGDHRADHKQNPADGSHRRHDRRHDRRDVEHGGQDQAKRGHDLKDAKGLDEANTGVFGPFAASMLSQFLLGVQTPC